MSKSARSSRTKLPCATSISGGEPNQGLEAMLHVTQVQTSCEDDVEYYFYKNDSQQSQSDLSLEVKQPDLEDEVSPDPPFVALVSNLPMECNERELTQVFSSFSICTLNVPRKGKRPKGFAYLELNSREELIRLLRLEKVKCRGRLLSIKQSPERENMPGKGLGSGGRTVAGHGGGDAHCSPLLSSDFDATSVNYSASASDLSASETPSSTDGSPRLGSESSIYLTEIPISRKPSSIEELERRMDIRLQKLAEFENAQSEREQLGDQDDELSMSWSDVLSETRKSEGL